LDRYCSEGEQALLQCRTLELGKVWRSYRALQDLQMVIIVVQALIRTCTLLGL